jgi:hypothetical protein
MIPFVGAVLRLEDKSKTQAGLPRQEELRCLEVIQKRQDRYAWHTAAWKSLYTARTQEAIIAIYREHTWHQTPL